MAVDLSTGMQDLEDVRHVALRTAVDESLRGIQSTLRGGVEDLLVLRKSELEHHPAVLAAVEGLDKEQKKTAITYVILCTSSACFDAVWKDMTGTHPLDDLEERRSDEKYDQAWHTMSEDINDYIMGH